MTQQKNQPVYAIGFIDPTTNQRVYINSNEEYLKTEEGLSDDKKEVFFYSEYGARFSSKTQAKGLQRDFRVNFTEQDHAEECKQDRYKNLSLNGYDVKVKCQIFDLNAEMLQMADRKKETAMEYALN